MNDTEAVDRSTFLTLAGLFQCGMLILALGLASWLEIDLWQALEWNPWSLVWGGLAAVPLCGLSVWIQHSRWQPFREIQEAWQTGLVPSLTDCRRMDFVLLSIMVGISEELLFRGVLQSWLSSWNVWAAILMANLVFGLAHAVTRVYIFLAMCVGLYFSALMWLTEPDNLWTPIVAHALCDWFAFERLKRVALATPSHCNLP